MDNNNCLLDASISEINLDSPLEARPAGDSTRCAPLIPAPLGQPSDPASTWPLAAYVGDNNPFDVLSHRSERNRSDDPFEMASSCAAAFSAVDENQPAVSVHLPQASIIKELHQDIDNATFDPSNPPIEVGNASKLLNGSVDLSNSILNVSALNNNSLFNITDTLGVIKETEDLFDAKSPVILNSSSFCQTKPADVDNSAVPLSENIEAADVEVFSKHRLSSFAETANRLLESSNGSFLSSISVNASNATWYSTVSDGAKMRSNSCTATFDDTSIALNTAFRGSVGNISNAVSTTQYSTVSEGAKMRSNSCTATFGDTSIALNTAFIGSVGQLPPAADLEHLTSKPRSVSWGDSPYTAWFKARLAAVAAGQTPPPKRPSDASSFASGTSRSTDSSSLFSASDDDFDGGPWETSRPKWETSLDDDDVFIADGPIDGPSAVDVGELLQLSPDVPPLGSDAATATAASIAAARFAAASFAAAKLAAAKLAAATAVEKGPMRAVLPVGHMSKSVSVQTASPPAALAAPSPLITPIRFLSKIAISVGPPMETSTPCELVTSTPYALITSQSVTAGPHNAGIVSETVTTLRLSSADSTPPRPSAAPVTSGGGLPSPGSPSPAAMQPPSRRSLPPKQRSSSASRLPIPRFSSPAKPLAFMSPNAKRVDNGPGGKARAGLQALQSLFSKKRINMSEDKENF